MKRRAPNMKYLEINTTSMRLYCLSASQRRDLATARQHGCYLKYAKIMGLDKMLTGHCGTYNTVKAVRYRPGVAQWVPGS